MTQAPLAITPPGAVRMAVALAIAFGAIVVELAALLLVLHASGMRLDAYSILAFPVLVGITIDEALFMIHEFHEARGDPASRARSAVLAVGRSTVGTTTTTAAGFLALLACGFDGLRSIGIVAGGGALVGLFTALVVVPALLRVATAQKAGG